MIDLGDYAFKYYNTGIITPVKYLMNTHIEKAF